MPQTLSSVPPRAVTSAISSRIAWSKMMAAALWLKARLSVGGIFSSWPAAQPTAMAKKFLKAAQISTPITSGEVRG